MTVHATHDRSTQRLSTTAHRSSRADLRRAPLDVRHLILDVCATHPAQANGVFTVAKQLAWEQLKAGDSARIIFLCDPDSRSGVGPGEVPIAVCPVVAPTIKGRPLFLPAAIKSTLMAGTGRGTVFHIHGGRNPLLIHVAQMLRRHNLPYAVTVHGRYSHLFNDRMQIARRAPALYLRWFEGRALKGARFVHAVSPVERDILHHLSPAARIEFIANAAYSTAMDGSPPAPSRSAPSSDFPRFGYFGRLEIEHKGLDLLVEGFARYRNNGGKGHLAIFGTGPAFEKLAGLIAASGASDWVTLDGPRFGEAKFETLRGWDYLVMPSRFDGMPIAALEAALVGLPLLVSPATGLGELIETFDAGDMIRPLTADGVADALSRAETATPRVWRGKSANAYRMAVAAGDWTAVAEQMRSLYTRS